MQTSYKHWREKLENIDNYIYAYETYTTVFVASLFSPFKLVKATDRLSVSSERT